MVNNAFIYNLLLKYSLPGRRNVPGLLVGAAVVVTSAVVVVGGCSVAVITGVAVGLGTEGLISAGSAAFSMTGSRTGGSTATARSKDRLLLGTGTASIALTGTGLCSTPGEMTGRWFVD